MIKQELKYLKTLLYIKSSLYIIHNQKTNFALIVCS